MENKELKKPIPVELDDDVLEDATGGVVPARAFPLLCPQCGVPRGYLKIDEAFYCISYHRELVDRTLL